MSRTLNLALIPGDGIGTEVVAEAIKVLEAISVPMPSPGRMAIFMGFSLNVGEVGSQCRGLSAGHQLARCASHGWRASRSASKARILSA